jgi:hypothetical protein
MRYKRKNHNRKFLERNLISNVQNKFHRQQDPWQFHEISIFVTSKFLNKQFREILPIKIKPKNTGENK